MSVCFVLEGGAMRGNFTAGILDYLTEKNFTRADTVVGVSAGALCGLNYCSRQPGRSVRVNATYCSDWRFMSMKSFVSTGDAVGVDFMYNKIQNEYDPFDYESFAKDTTDFRVVCTNIETGSAEYLPVKTLPHDTDYVRASASIPLISKTVEVDGLKLLDGGTADSIPVKWALERGFDKVLVVLTQDRGYKKGHEKTMPLIKKRYSDYPAFCKALENRHYRYNACRNKVFDLEKEGSIFVLAPKKPVEISSMEKNPAKIMSLYNEGREAAKENLTALDAYLSH